MESVLEGFRESHSTYDSRFPTFHGNKMATVFDDQQNRKLYYDYTQNFDHCDPSTYDNQLYTVNKNFPQPTRLSAYDYQLYNDRKCSYIREPDYSSVRTDYGFVAPDEWNNPSLLYENDFVYSHHKKVRNNRNSTRSRSKSSDRRRRSLPQNLWCNNLPRNGVISQTAANYHSGSATEPHPYDMRNDYSLAPTITLTTLPAEGMHQADLAPAVWQQSHWPREIYRSPEALSPPSPLDSGLSSQSVASSPSLDAEPVHARRIAECSSPVPLSVIQRNQCSCYPDPNVLSPPIRSDSGRSSPWAQSAVSRLNALTEGKSTDVPYNASPIVDSVIISPYDFDPRRYSMSGIYINPQERKSNHTSSKNVEIGKDKIPRKKYVSEKRSVSGYEQADNTASRVSSKHLRAQRSIKFKPLENGAASIEYPDKESAEAKAGEQKENPESATSVPNSSSLTESVSTISNQNTDIRKSKISNSEKAICELEEMYNKLNLQDYDLLDRAERRDLPTQHQIRIPNGIPRGLTRSKSDSFYEILGPNYCYPFKKQPRAPPLRRSGVPDLIADDMAIRKLQKSSPKSHHANENISSYMLYSSHFTPSISLPNGVLISNRPDVEYDDLSFRKYFHLSSGRIEDPQPPFGIPLNPNPPQSVFSDYLHVVPSGVPPPLCHPRGNPDLVRDDLAFRSLRKDNPERAMYDSYSLFYRKVR